MTYMIYQKYHHRAMDCFLWITEEDLTDFILWASDDGFQWLEVRDFDDTLSKNLLSRLNDFALECNLFFYLAWDGAVFIAPYDEDVWHQKIAKATVFDGPGYFRITLSTNTVDRSGKGFSKEQFSILKDRISRILGHNGKQGVWQTFENSFESIHSSEESFCGFMEILNELTEIEMCLDTAIFTNLAQLLKPESTESVLSFICDFAELILYVHLIATIGKLKKRLSRNRLLLKAAERGTVK